AKRELASKLDEEIKEKENITAPGRTKELMINAEAVIKSVKEIKKDLEVELVKAETKIQELEKELAEAKSRAEEREKEIKDVNEFSKIKFTAKSSEEFQVLLENESELIELDNAYDSLIGISDINILNLKDRPIYGMGHLFSEECEIPAILGSEI